MTDGGIHTEFEYSFLIIDGTYWVEWLEWFVRVNEMNLLPIIHLTLLHSIIQIVSFPLLMRNPPHVRGRKQFPPHLFQSLIRLDTGWWNRILWFLLVMVIILIVIIIIIIVKLFQLHLVGLVYLGKMAVWGVLVWDWMVGEDSPSRRGGCGHGLGLIAVEEYGFSSCCCVCNYMLYYAGYYALMALCLC